MTGEPNYKYVPPPLDVVVEDMSCVKCAELTERCRMQSETIGRYVDEKLALQNRLALLGALNDVAYRLIRGEYDATGQER